MQHNCNVSQIRIVTSTYYPVSLCQKGVLLTPKTTFSTECEMFTVKSKTFGRFAMVASIFLGMAACSDSTGTGDATLSVRLTDAPHPMFERVDVTIGEIEIFGSNGAPVSVTSSGGTFNLLDFQDGVTASLASLTLEPGTYNQLRIVIEEASVTLRTEFQFADGSQSKTLTVPSGAQTGIKFNLDAADGDASSSGIEIVPGETILVVDFDVTQNFKVQGSPNTPAGIQTVLFTPLLRAVVQDIAGSISGTISGTGLAGVADSSVSAVLLESGVIDALQTAEATGVIDSSGTYSINFLSPGTYRVSVSASNATATPTSIDVVVADGQDVIGTDFTVTVP